MISEYFWQFLPEVYWTEEHAQKGHRAGLKPMQPMRLHWAPRPRGPRATVFGRVVYFCQILLAHENC